MIKDLGADPTVLTPFALGHARAAPEAVDGPSTRLDRAAALTASTVGADPEAQDAAIALSAALALGAASSRLGSKLVALGAARLCRDGRLSPTLLKLGVLDALVLAQSIGGQCGQRRQRRRRRSAARANPRQPGVLCE